MKSCDHCGKENPYDYNFCMRCGQLLDLSPQSTAAPASSAHFDESRLPSTSANSIVREAMPEETYEKRLQQYGSNLPVQQKLYFQQEYDKQSRNPSTALILTLLLGGAGAHRFYLGQWGWGAAYLVFFWTCVPLLLALVECFLIRARTETYNELVVQQILDKMDIIFSKPGMSTPKYASI
jgi:TM2 domain-containing membrane protein YozV